MRGGYLRLNSVSPSCQYSFAAGTKDKDAFRLAAAGGAVTNISLTIDVVPAVLGFAAVSSIVLIVLAAYLHRASSHRQLWAAGILSFAAGMLLLIARGQIDDVLSILAANLLIIGAYAGFAAGTNRFVGRSTGLPFAIGAAAVVVFITAFALGASLETRVVIISVLSVAECVVLVLGFLHARQHWAATLAAAVFAINAFLAAARLLGVLNLIPVPGGIGLLHALVLNYGVAVALGVSISLIALNIPVLRPVRAAAPPLILAPAGMTGWQLLRARSALVAPGGAEVRLTGSEYILLRELGGGGEPVMRAVLNASIGRGAANPKDRSIDILISRLRRKCTDTGIELPVTSVRGMGYVFTGPLRLAD